MFAALMVLFRTILNSIGDNASPCLSPLFFVNILVLIFPIFILLVDPFTHAFVRQISFCGIDISVITSQSFTLRLLSYACLKSMTRWWVYITEFPVFSKHLSNCKNLVFCWLVLSESTLIIPNTSFYQRY